ncbi:hypothetical protein BP6252_02819 [Coleophoma cylindrospora]|uniref:Uncharacterized protein n=1 Tax=Coleophoma cylindrospora TaxID=1849047 RepID=A0A3D8SFW7_9HELO|nr:hypothetical protein BP6252_02819 [Coleophoma cylindrospora]
MAQPVLPKGHGQAPPQHPSALGALPVSPALPIPIMLHPPTIAPEALLLPYVLHLLPVLLCSAVDLCFFQLRLYITFSLASPTPNLQSSIPRSARSINTLSSRPSSRVNHLLADSRPRQSSDLCWTLPKEAWAVLVRASPAHFGAGSASACSYFLLSTFGAITSAFLQLRHRCDAGWSASSHASHSILLSIYVVLPFLRPGAFPPPSARSTCCPHPTQPCATSKQTPATGKDINLGHYSIAAASSWQGGEFTLDSIPTVGFNMKRVQKGHVTLKCWDLGGQPRFRSMWERYCRGVNAIVFIVDSADTEALPVAKEELHELLEKPVLEGIPLLVLGNKSDLEEKLSVDELIEALDLKSISHREVSCYGISAKEETNLDAVLQWLVARASH